MIINPGFDEIVNISVESEETYECRYNQTVNLMLNEETIDADTGRINCKLKFGTIVVPIQFRDEVMKQTEITGAGAFKWKFTERKSLEYRNGKIIAGTKEFSLPKFSSQKSFRYAFF